MTDRDRRLKDMDTDKQCKLDELDELCRKQDAEHEAKQAKREATIAELTGGLSIPDYIEEKTKMSDETTLDETDADRLRLLDRLAERLPGLDLDQHEIDWTKLDDGSEALLMDGGGIDGGSGAYFANYGDDVHAVGSLAPLAPKVGLIVIRPDGSRYLAQLADDPLARGNRDE